MNFQIFLINSRYLAIVDNRHAYHIFAVIWNSVNERQRKTKDTGVTFRGNENLTVIELCAKKIQPLRNPQAKKLVSKGKLPLSPLNFNMVPVRHGGFSITIV